MSVKVYCDICNRDTTTWKELSIAEILGGTPWLCLDCYKKVVDIIRLANKKEPSKHESQA